MSSLRPIGPWREEKGCLVVGIILASLVVGLLLTLIGRDTTMGLIILVVLLLLVLGGGYGGYTRLGYGGGIGIGGLLLILLLVYLLFGFGRF